MNDYKLNQQGGILCKDYHCCYNEGNGICEYGGCKDIKKTITLPVQWSMCGTIEIEANSIQDAIRIFEETQDDIDLPTREGDYIDSSFEICDKDESYIKLFNLNN